MGGRGRARACFALAARGLISGVFFVFNRWRMRTWDLLRGSSSSILGMCSTIELCAFDATLLARGLHKTQLSCFENFTHIGCYVLQSSQARVWHTQDVNVFLVESEDGPIARWSRRNECEPLRISETHTHTHTQLNPRSREKKHCKYVETYWQPPSLEPPLYRCRQGHG